MLFLFIFSFWGMWVLVFSSLIWDSFFRVFNSLFILVRFVKNKKYFDIENVMVKDFEK